MIHLLALSENAEQTSFFEQVAQHFAHLFTLTISLADANQTISPDAAGLLTLSADNPTNLPRIGLSLTENDADFYLPNLDLASWDSQTALRLAAYLTKAVKQLETSTWLTGLPLHASLIDQNNQVITHNHKPKDAFLFDQIDASPLPDWQFQELASTPNHASHVLLPSISFDQILMESTQGLYQDSQFQGAFQQVWDIKPLLASYLQETGQAIVGWSDVTSGASIKNSLFDDEDF